MNENLKYWIALRMADGVGGVATKKLMAEFGSPESLFTSNKSELSRVNKVVERNPEKIIEALKGFSDWDKVDQEIGRAEKLGFNILTLDDPGYPESLLNIYNPPPVLYVKGSMVPEDALSIAIVGTRIPDRYGRTITETLSGGLAARGITIATGMARGIDSIAQAESLRRGGRTIGVLGFGLDVVYPPENIRLYNDIAQSGAVISEFPLGTGPLAQNFPQRNRIISGLSLGVIVVQAAEKSGSLISASFALNQNKEVFAVPGPAGKKLSRGSNWLIKKGAKLVETVDDVLSEIGIQSGPEARDPKERQSLIDTLSENEKTVYAVFKTDAIHVDEIIQLTGMEPSNVLSILLSLELNGFVAQLQGKYFQLKL